MSDRHERETRLTRDRTNQREADANADIRPPPFVPYFGWRPGMDDFPVSLVSPQHALRRRPPEPASSNLTDEIDWVKHIEVLAGPRPRSKLMPIIAALVLIAGALAVGVYRYEFTNRPSPTVADAPAAQASPTDQMLQGGAEESSPTQQAGLGGGMPAREGDEATATASDAMDAFGAVDAPTATSTSTSTGAITPSTGTVQPDPRGTEKMLFVKEAEAREGESLLDIARRFNVEVSSVLWSNPDMSLNDELKAGTTVIVPATGSIAHRVKAGDTHESIAARYGVEVSDLFGSDGSVIDPGENLTPGELMGVRGGVVADRGGLGYYTVVEGDTLWTIASYYGLQPQTLAWANGLPRPELIYPGQELIVPPGDGALVIAEEGSTVESLISSFDADYEAVINYEFNGLADGSVLQSGQWLMIPGDLFAPLGDGPTELSASTVVGEDVAGPATGSFLWPADGTVTQGFNEHHTGLDIANEEWSPVSAADGGIVIFSGWNDYGLGYAVGIDHGNGFVTWYGHMVQQPYVEVGQVIWQGGYLGPMGSTGNSTGPHVHFIIMKDGVYLDPMEYLE